MRVENIVKWQIHNSWSDGNCKYVMSHDWFLKNVEMIVVHVDMLNSEEKEVYELSKTADKCIVIKNEWDLPIYL